PTTRPSGPSEPPRIRFPRSRSRSTIRRFPTRRKRESTSSMSRWGMRSDRLTVRAILLSLALLRGHRVAEAAVTVPPEVERALLDVARKELAQDALAAGAESTRSGGNEDASHSDGRKDAVHAGGSEEPVGSVALSVEGEAISLSSSQRAELAKILD